MIPLYDDHRLARPPVITWGLVVIILAVFGYELTLSAAAQTPFFTRFGLVPSFFWTHQAAPEAWMSVVTNLFIHGGWLHLLTNVAYLWAFGRRIEDLMGRTMFSLLYLGCGMMAVLAYSVVQRDSNALLVGASASIAAVLGAYVLAAPYARVLTLFPGYGLRRVSAWLLLGLWWLIQVGMTLFADSEQLGVGFEVHAVGFALGMVGVWMWNGMQTGRWRIRLPILIPDSRET